MADVFPGASVLLAALLAGAGVHLAVPPLMPLFRRYAMARPNARSSHRIATPQGGGLPIVAAVVLVAAAFALAGLTRSVPLEIARYHTLALFAGVALGLLGAADDIRPMPATTRLAMQTILAAVVVFAAPEHWRLLPGTVPAALERAVTVVAFVWMVNLTNFMDGIDGIVVAEAAPVAAALALFGIAGVLDGKAAIVAAALCGALLGFAPHNRHPARLFLGDVGSLPIGFLLAALLFELAATAGVAAALLLPLYFLVDATGTLVAGLRAGHDVMRAHRRHAYQNAVDAGWSAPAVTRRILVLNLGLAGLAAACVAVGDIWVEAALLAVGLAATLGVVARFRAGPP